MGNMIHDITVIMPRGCMKYYLMQPRSQIVHNLHFTLQFNTEFLSALRNRKFFQIELFIKLI